MNGARFADVAAIQERVAAVLRSIPKQAFADSFQKLYERFQQCVVKDDDYLKANKVNLFVSSVLFVFWYHSPNVLDTPLIFCRIERPHLAQQFKFRFVTDVGCMFQLYDILKPAICSQLSPRVR
jgi:hypothetical protein